MSKAGLAVAAASRPASGVRPPGSGPAPLGSALLTELGWAEVSRSLRLTARERQVVQGVFDNKIEEAMASELGISAHTVHAHLSHLYAKLGATTRAEVVLLVWRELIAPILAPHASLPPLCPHRASARCPLRGRVASKHHSSP